MGEQKVSKVNDKRTMHRFVRHLLNDVQALDHMLTNDWFERDVVRIGAEQEMCMVWSSSYKPAPIAMEVLEKMKEYPWAETELARFNLETNLQPRVFENKCLSLLEKENSDKIQKINEVLKTFGAEVVLTGILPTLRKLDLEIHNLTPKKRYKALIDGIHEQLMGSAFELRLSGIDELLVKHKSPLLEACNTSFQVHLQVDPNRFVHFYNIAQVLAAPVMAIASNSPLVFGRRLWHESRIALFQQALDTRSTLEHMRERSPRVNFGSNWLDESVMEIYQEDIARFRVLLSGDVEEDSLAMIADGKVPKLRALQVHNSTVYRWNRPCYGVSPNGKPHLRIENRVLPSGPSVRDEVASAALWLGAMMAMTDQFEDIRKEISFWDAKDNFGKAARYGIDATFTWLKDKKIGACDLITKELAPLARHGLALQKVDQSDIDTYIGVVEERAKAHTSGARWLLRSFTNLKDSAGDDEVLATLTACTIKNQRKGLPVHKWEMTKLTDLEDYSPAKLKVEEFMQTDLFTVQQEDLIELVAEMMDWRKIRYTPVEDIKGKLIGLVSSRLLLRHLTRARSKNKRPPKTVKDIMIVDPMTVTPDTTIMKAMGIMQEHQIGCLPVEVDGELVGVITEMDFLRISSRLMERLQQKSTDTKS